MIGKIRIEDYKMNCLIGIHPHEQVKEQEILITIEIEYDISKCIKSDTIADAINYAEVAQLCEKMTPCHLLETFAAKLLERIFDQFDLLYASVQVNKPGAIPQAKATSIKVERRI